VAPPSSKMSHPGRVIAALAALIIIMLVGIIGGAAGHPASWRHQFKVGLGLDLSSGTTVTLKAVTGNKTKAPSQTEMNEARSIMVNRVNGAGFTGALVQQQGPDIITVAVPGQGAQKVESLVGRTALLRFRQVLLVASNLSLPGTTPTQVPTAPLPIPSPTPTGSAANPGTSPTANPSPSPSSGALGATPGAGSGGQGLAGQAARLGPAAAAASKPRAGASPTSSAPASPTATPSGSASPSTSPSPQGTPTLSTVAQGTGDASALSPAVKTLFNKLNCANPKWQQQTYGANSLKWDDVSTQIVTCFQGQKYALDKAPVTGEMLSSASASLNTNGTWQVNLNFNSQGANRFGTLTEGMFTKYQGSATNPLNTFAIVLDGVPVSIPFIQQAITTGQGQISGTFTQTQATDLANVLSYGHLPLSFQNQSTESISAQLGSSQLHAGLIAAAIGLLLVVIYSFLYYRGLGVVSVSSLVIAALLAYMSVVLLSKYQGFTMNLAGVAGLIVAIGITADSFVVFFERLRDEVREGRTLRPAVERGWTRARRTILVSDTVSFLAAALLYYFAIGDVKGFAFTLGLTTIIDVLVVFTFTKPMVTLLARTKFYGQGHPLSGLDPARLGARSPWRGAKRPAVRAAGEAGATAATPSRTTPKEA
jgi:preprotein translocase subunit SecD